MRSKQTAKIPISEESLRSCYTHDSSSAYFFATLKQCIILTRLIYANQIVIKQYCVCFSFCRVFFSLFLSFDQCFCFYFVFLVIEFIARAMFRIIDRHIICLKCDSLSATVYIYYARKRKKNHKQFNDFFINFFFVICEIFHTNSSPIGIFQQRS